jgi:acyl-ACP thioesterase
VAGRVFACDVRAAPADVAPGGRVRLDALARWLQDAAYADVFDAGLHEDAVWVLRRTGISVRRFPRFGEAVAVRTWCSGLGRMWAQRTTTLEGGGGARVEAVALWVHLGPGGTRPAPFSARELEVYGPSATAHDIKARLRHPGPEDAATTGTWRFRAADLDLLNHVNNAVYWQVLEERLIGGPEPAALEAEIEYRTPVGVGSVDLAEREDLLWLTAGAEVVASIRSAAPRP